MENQDNPIEEIAPGVTIQWMYNGQIGIYTVRTIAATSLHIWVDSVEKVMTDWPVGRRLLLVQDQAYEGTALTPIMREAANRLSGYRPEIQMSQAIILPKGLVNQLASNLMWLLRKPNRENRIFFTQQEGLTWLETKLPMAKSGKLTATAEK
jgi:hypothetical protein